jgi:hypothetical protein
MSPFASSYRLIHDSYWLWAESMMVMGMRTADMMTGRGSDRENALMVSEKVKAAADLGMQIATGGRVSPQKAVSHYRRKVTANRKRLARKKTK